MVNNDLRAIEDNLNQLIQLRNEVDTNRRRCTDQEYLNLVSDIRQLSGMREELLNAMRMNGNGFGFNQQQSYVDPRWQQNNNGMGYNFNNNNSGFGFQNQRQSVGYIPPVHSNNNASYTDNKFASKAVSAPVQQSFQPQQPQPKQQPVQEPLKASEGSEFILCTAPGLECRKEVNNGWYRYEVYGNPNTVSQPKTDKMPNDTKLISDAKKHCLDKKMDGTSAILVKFKYGNGSGSADDINKKISNSGLVDGLVGLRNLDSSISKYLDIYFTKILNKCMAGGMKRKLSIDSVISDLDELSGLVGKESVRLQTYYETIKSSIRKDFNTNISVEIKDGLYTVTHKAPYVYVESNQVIGDLEKVMMNNDICCIKQDSNPGLFKVFEEHFKLNKGYIHSTFYSINNINRVSRYVVCQDINNNFILAK